MSPARHANTTNRPQRRSLLMRATRRTLLPMAPRPTPYAHAPQRPCPDAPLCPCACSRYPDPYVQPPSLGCLSWCPRPMGGLMG